MHWLDFRNSLCVWILNCTHKIDQTYYLEKLPQTNQINPILNRVYPLNGGGRIYPTLTATSPTPTLHLAQFLASFSKPTLLFSFSTCVFQTKKTFYCFSTSTNKNVVFKIHLSFIFGLQKLRKFHTLRTESKTAEAKLKSTEQQLWKIEEAGRKNEKVTKQKEKVLKWTLFLSLEKHFPLVLFRPCTQVA